MFSQEVVSPSPSVQVAAEGHGSLVAGHVQPVGHVEPAAESIRVNKAQKK